MTDSSGNQERRLAYQVVADSRPKRTYRGAVVGCGRMGSTIDDEHVGLPHYPWPWAHAPAMIEAAGVELVAGADIDRARLDDFAGRWGVRALYTDIQEMVAKERPDIVSVTTRPEERPEVVAALAEAGVKAIFATKPLCRTLAQADEMIDVCRRNGTILTMACHLNWYGPYTAARELIQRGDIGPLRSLVGGTTHTLSNIGSHTLALFRMFAGAPASWVFGHMDDDSAASGDGDLPGSGYVVYENGVRAFLNSRVPAQTWSLELLCEKGRIVSRNHHATFELWTEETQAGDRGLRYDVQRMFPYPWRPRSSMVDAIEGVARSIEAGRETVAPGEYGRESLEIAIALRESHRRGGARVDLPLQDRSLGLGLSS
jgi:predicted dehydrogenase